MSTPRKYRRRKLAAGSLAATEIAKVGGCELQLAHKSGATGFDSRKRHVHRDVAHAVRQGNVAHAEYERRVQGWDTHRKPGGVRWLVLLIIMLIGAAAFMALAP
jgi:hypothetical protein